MTRADQLIRAVLDEAFAHSTSTPKRLDMILTSGVLKGQFSHHHWAKPSASRGSKKIVSFSDNPYYSHHDNGPALLFHRHAVGDQVYTPIKIDDHDHYDWVKNNLDKIDPSLHSEYGDHADTMTAMLHAGWIRKANSDSYTVGEGHEHRVRAYHLRTHPEEREIYIDVRHRNKKRSSYRYNLDTRTKVKLGESADSLIKAVLNEITKPAKVSFSKMGPSPEIPDEIRNMTFFHGVHDGDRGEQILRSGRLVPSTYGVGSRWDKSLTPRDDKVYLAQDRVGAISYMQHQWNEHTPWYQGEPKSKYSYLFQVSGHDLNHVEADEDDVRHIYKQTHAWDAEPEYRHQIHPDNVNHEVAHQGRSLISPEEHQVMVTRLRLKRLDHIAKKLANKLPSHLHHDMIIKNKAAVAHGGPVKITGAWRVHKDKLDQLNRYDDSNFDDIAEPVHHLIGKQESIDENTVAKGECFSWAFKRLLDHHVKGEHDAVLVHASVKHPWTGKRYEHAWVEHKGKVYDWQSTAMGLGKQHTVASFKAGYEPKQIKRYNGKQAVRASARAKHYGPW